MKYVVIVFLFVLVSGGCIPTSPEAPEGIRGEPGAVSAEDLQGRLIGELTSILKEPERYRNSSRPYKICDELALMSPTALSPIIELLGVADTSPETKIFILQSVNINMTDAYLPFIEPLLASADPTTRSCATTLLGPIRSDAVVELLVRLKEDENSLVSFSAWSGLAQQEKEPYRREFIEYYADPEASIAERSEIVRIMVTRTRPEDVPTLGMAVSDEETTPGVRRMIAIILGNMGTSASIEALGKSIEVDTEADYRTLAESAIALITERNNV